MRSVGALPVQPPGLAPRAGFEPASPRGQRSIRNLHHRPGWLFCGIRDECRRMKVQPGNKRLRYRRSTTELLGLALRAGLEPATSGLRGEVTAAYTTGQGGNRENAPSETAPGNKRRETGYGLSARRGLVIRDCAPLRQVSTSGRVSGPASPWSGGGSNSLLSPPTP